MSGKVSGLAVFYGISGAVLLWSGFKGQTTTQTIKAITSGSSGALQAQGTETISSPGLNISDQAGSSGSAATASQTSATGPTATASQAQATAKMLAIAMGHSDWTTGQQWADWVALWDRESGWRWNATNPSSGAYGIPQALPAAKMASAGSDWKTNGATQIKWGIGYIAGGNSYGATSPSAAWAHEQSAGWY
jgi:hypothetical protein